MLAHLDATGGTAVTYPLPDRCYYHPGRLRRILKHWHESYDPWVKKNPDERGMSYQRNASFHDSADIRNADRIAPVKEALLYLSVIDPVCYDAIVGLYIEVSYDHEVAAWQGSNVRTVWKRVDRGINLMSTYLGYDRSICEQEETA